MKWIKKLLSKFKNNKEDMFNENELISYKQNFTGESFQWIKTTNPSLIGKVVKCRDVQPQGNTIVAIFEDGSSIPVSRLNNDLMMIHGDMQPLSKAEVESINGPMVDPMANMNKKATPVVEEIVPSLNGAEPSGRIAEVKPRPEPVFNQAKAENPFKMFNSDETDFMFKLRIKLPDKKLLKMMYNSAEDKDEFISQLSEFVHQSLTEDVIQESLKSMLASKPKVQKTPSEKKESIKLIQVENDERSNS